MSARAAPTLALVVAGAAFAAAAAVAQARATGSGPCPPDRPPLECRSFFLHLGLATRLADIRLSGPPIRSGEELPIGVEAGFMRRRAGRTALGASIWWNGFPDGHVGAAIRFRRWIAPGMALDVAPGVGLVRMDGLAPQSMAVQPVVRVSFTVKELIGISLRAEFNRVERFDLTNARTTTTGLQWYGGAHLGTRLAPFGALGLLGLALASIAACAGGCGL